MRVLQLLSSTAFHGAESMAAELIRQLATLGVSNHIAILDNAGRADKQILKATEGAVEHSMTLPCDGAFDVATFKALAAYVREHRIDVIHSHKYKTTFYALPVAKRHGCGLVTTYHNWINTTPALRFYTWLDLKLARFNDVSIGVSTPVIKTLRAHVPPGRLRQIDNGIDTSVFTLPTSRHAAQEQLEARLNRPLNGVVFGCVGRLSQEKGIDRLLTALAGTDASRPWTLLLVGDGDERARLEAQAQLMGIADRVQFLGHRSDTPQLYQAMDYYLLPSYVEAFPMALLEAMSCGCEVIAADVGEIARILDQGHCGTLAPATGHDEWTAALSSVLKPSAPRTGVSGARGRHRVESHYSSLAMAQAYLAAYRQCA